MRSIVAVLLLATCSTPSSAPTPAVVVSPSTHTFAPHRRRSAAIVARPATLDLRSDAQLAAAACAGPFGWRCSTRPMLAASAATPIIPSSWTVPGWSIDPQNYTGCASDANSGTAAACSGGCAGSVCTSGVGPLKSYQELLVHRWGCQGVPGLCPRLQQTTTLTFLSSHTDDSDPVIGSFGLDNGSQLLIVGQLGAAQTVCTGLITLVATKNTATPQLLEVTLPCAVATGDMVVNTTHASRAWVYGQVSGNSWTMTQPLTAENTTTWAGPTEVNSWMTNDTVTIYKPTAVNIESLDGQQLDFNATFANQIGLVDLTIFDPNPGRGDNVYLAGSTIMVAEVTSQRIMVIDYTQGGGNVQRLDNVDVQFGIDADADFLIVIGGDLSPNAVIEGEFGSVSGANMEGDWISGANTFLRGNATVAGDGMYVGTGAMVGSFASDLAIQSGAVVWGPGTLNAMASCRVAYKSGVGGATATFPITTLQVDSQTKSCVGAPGAASAYGTCNVTLNASNLDSDLGSTTGCLGTPNGAAFCNYGP